MSQFFPTRTDLSQLPPSVRLTSVLAPHFISSSPSCDHNDACECPVEFECPLCQFESRDLSLVETHYTFTHWQSKIEVGKYTLFPCGASHATLRQSMVHRILVPSLHFHCPLCPVTDTSGEQMRQHLLTRHPAASAPPSQEPSPVLPEVKRVCLPDMDAGSVPTGKLHWDPTVTVREFPLAMSIVEQTGGRSESKKPPNSFDGYAMLHEMAQMTSVDCEISGCNQPVMKLFKGLCFVLCGIDITPSTVAAIHSLGGVITGANYAESGEWSRVTHVLLGNRLGVKAVKATRRNIAWITSQIPDYSVQWVSSEWVRQRVENGSIFGQQRTFVPALIERFFTVKESATRTDRRKAIRSRPDIPTTSTREPEFSQRPSSPTVRTDLEVGQFTPTPEGSPQILTAPIMGAGAYSPFFMPTPGQSPAIQPIIPPPRAVPPIPRPKGRSPVPSATLLPSSSHVLPAHSILSLDAFAVRRSKRQSTAASPGKFTLLTPTTHVIKKGSE